MDIEKLVKNCAQAAYEADPSCSIEGLDIPWSAAKATRYHPEINRARAVIALTLRFVEQAERKMAALTEDRDDLFDRGSYAARMECADWCASLIRALATQADKTNG